MKRINLDQMKNMSIDNLIESYRSGYRLEEHTPITSLSNLPNFSNIHTLQGPLLGPVVNFGKVIVSIGYDAVTTSIILNINEGSKLPDSSSVFNLVWWNSTDYPDPSDDPNKEIVRCTARTTDTLTVTRAQEGTSATTKNTVGKVYKMILSPTAKMMSDISSAITARVVKSGDTMTGPLNLPSNGLIVGTNQLIVSGGNVGIGTTVPNATLDVEESGGATVRMGRTSSGFLQMDSDGTDGTIMMTGSGGIKLKTNGDNIRMYIKNDGNVGIGTTSPSSTLNIYKDYNQDYNINDPDGTWGTIKLYNSGNDINPATGIQFVGGSSGNSYGGIVHIKTTSGDGRTSIVSSTDGGTTNTESFTVIHNGNVGIGITTPTSKLQTSGSFSAQVITISGSVTLDETYYTVLCNAGTAFTVTLPDASTCPGRIYNIKKKDSSTNTVTIATTGGQTIDGATSRSINIQYETVSTQSDGIQWWIV